jgi:mannose-1-phosphate guanylyltransferase
MILCAGLGTRLRPLTTELAKPLVPVGDRPALAHVLERVRAIASRVVVNAHHRPYELARFCALEQLALSHEPELLGTAGGLANAAALLGAGDVLVYNGDILCDLELGEVVRAHDAEATLVVRPAERGAGNVGLDEGGRIVRLRAETTSGGEARGGEFIGIHVLGAGLRARLPPKGCLVADVYLPALRRGAELRAFCTDAPFYDIGSLSSYLAANLAWLGDRASFVAEGAHVDDGVRLDRAVVGDGARVAGEGLLARSVVWPGAIAKAPLADAIATPTRVVHLTG